MVAFFLKTTLVWAALYLLFYALLRRETFHRANRFYLLGALAAGLLLPILSGWLLLNDDAKMALLLQEVSIGLENWTEQSSQSNRWLPGLLTGVWLLGALAAAGRLAWGLWQIHSLTRHAQHEQNQGFSLLRTTVPHPPFSFFQRIFCSKNVELPANEFQAVLRHEAAHVRQLHSLDVLALELLAIPFWWNPLLWCYRRSLRTLHEYLADESVLAEFPLHQYGTLLIRQSLSGTSLAIVHFFNRSLLKSRIQMMTKTSSNPAAGWKFLLALPLLALLLLNFSAAENIPVLHGDVDEMPVWSGCENESSAEARSQCSFQKTMSFLINNIKYPAEAVKQKLEGKVYVEYTVTKKGAIADVKVKKSASPSLDAEALRVVKLMPKMVAAKKDGKSVAAQVTLPVAFRLE